MSKYKFSISSLVLGILLLSSCEETMIMIPDNPGPPPGDKTVLIEDLTGVQCPNCPKGTAAIDNILSAFAGRVYAIAIHGTLQAEPIPGESKYDFRNQFAIDLEEFHKPWFGKPTAMINRNQFDNEINIGVDDIDLWLSYTEEELGKANEVTILSSHTYDPSSRALDVSTTIFPINDLEGEVRLSVFITESDIEDAQENQTTVIEEYIHNHVLRHMMTPFDGAVLGNELVEGESLNRTFSYTVPEEFNDSHLEVVISVHRNSPSKNVLQSEGFKVGE